MERVKVVFIFVAEDADPVVNRGVVYTPTVEFNTIGVPNYQVAAETASEMADYGCILVELCAGFDETGTKMVIDAVKGRAKVGTCWIDYVPDD